MHTLTPTMRNSHDGTTTPDPAAPGPASDRPTAERSAGPALRLALARPGSARALLDGAWWPYSRDLTAELPGLIEALDARWDRITRVTVNPTYWPIVPHKVPVPGHVVKVGWFAEQQDPHSVMLLSYQVGRWDLLVIPPETDPDTADRLMAATSDPQRPMTASQLMAEAGHGTEGPDAAASTDQDMEAVWTSEGGTVADGLPSVAGAHD
ncbi:DUF5994 family protein [Streptomyces sp. NBC_00669]|uniref:DUF5994 family protein n=1 Tax=Streptomyces sp. NBC_00669 TaxID=2976011 RepID=UPI002E30A4F5|nr:DUF5994 family protein [Streptomyces sp. NBC_00669]